VALRVLLMLVFMMGAGILVPPGARADSVLNHVLPSIFGPPTTGPKPEETLIAPFAQNVQQTRTLTEKDLGALIAPENAIPIDQAHRAKTYVADWAGAQVMMALNNNPGADEKARAARLKDITAAFLPTGRQGLEAYEAQNNLAQLGAQGQKIVAFSKSSPLLSFDGVHQGAFRWVVDVSVTLSILPVDLKNYQEKNRDGTAHIQTMMVRVQIVRVASGYPAGMAIESFTVL
jgi:hypothetical protein